MTCRDNQQMVAAYLDGDSVAAGDANFYRHCAECEECRSFISMTVRLREIRRMERIPWPGGLDEVILDRTSTPVGSPGFNPGSGRVRKFRLTFPLAAAFGVIMLLLGIFLGGWYDSRETRTLRIPAVPISDQPVTVIMMYSMPPVEVHGTRILNARDEQQFIR
jgi:hypothetical protein